ncbi:MAG: hypothetical protein HC876_12975 [Chloroflexaceae bacterium]|nr:hypothetical protein [Chloroflexaceae bacterium]
MLVLFEDENWRHFAPLIYTRPIYDIRCGAFALHERIRALLATRPDALAHTNGQALHLPLPLSQFAPILKKAGTDDGISGDGAVLPNAMAGLCRPYMQACYGPTEGLSALLRNSTPITLLNGRALSLEWLPDLLRATVNTVYVADGVLLGAKISPALASAVLYYLQTQRAADALEELQRFARVVEVEALLLAYPWDLINQAGEQLVRDLPLLAARLPRYTSHDPQIVVRGDDVYVSPTAKLDGPLVLDARDGPIYLDDECHIEPFSFIQGPAYVGKQTLVASARIRAETSLGPVCRVGGEIEASTFQGFSNKHHDGFLGHSWLGEWVNIGAMTTNSDLKNTYGNIKVVIEQLGSFNSGTLKLGCFWPIMSSSALECT